MPVTSRQEIANDWAARGFSANTIPTDNQGAGYPIAEGGTPRLVKAAYLSDAEIIRIADYATTRRAESGRAAA